MHSNPTSIDVILFGATGFPGRLVAEALQARAASAGLQWALAGRDAGRLAAVRRAIGAPDTLPLLTADAADEAALVRQPRLVITIVGPYTCHGTALAQACAVAGTDDVVLCGEPLWMAQMVRPLQAPAAASGVRTVLSCGFDSVPLDLGVLFLQADALQRFGQPLQRVQGRVLRMRGGVSGGTAASLRGHALALGWPPSRALIGRLALPQPGLGPCWRLRETGSVNLRFTGQTAYGRSLAATVHGDRDPGHGRTARMLAKSALRRLQAHAGLRFSLVA